ncbi:MAG: DUF4149 domain-containing protein [Nitrospiraceae bacterium]
MEAPRSVRRDLLACYTCEMVALAIWIGGLAVIIGSVIPAVFNSFGMEPGGRFLTRVFDGYNRAVMAAMVVLLLAGAVRLWISARYDVPRAAISQPEVILLGLMIVVAIAIILVLGPASVKLQEEAFAVKEETAKQVAYAAFFNTHKAVRGLYVLNFGLGIALVAVKLKSYIQSGS